MSHLATDVIIPIMILAGDVGGTKTLLGLFATEAERPRRVAVKEYATLDFDSLDDVVAAFVEDTSTDKVGAVAIGVAGPVTGHVARLTNVPWVADVSVVSERFAKCPALLLNDLEALGSSVAVLEPDELATLQEGVEMPSGNAAMSAWKAPGPWESPTSAIRFLTCTATSWPR